MGKGGVGSEIVIQEEAADVRMNGCSCPDPSVFFFYSVFLAFEHCTR